jgi:hypothetical protein
MEKHTSTFSQTIDYLMECMRLEARHSGGGFFIAVLVAILLGGLCWYAATQYTKLWNLHYTPTLTAQVLCGIAAVLTMLFTVAFISLDKGREIAVDHLNRWHRAINNDKKFQDETYAKVWYLVKKTGWERFGPTNPPPDQPHSTLPINDPRTRVFVGKYYADASVEHFRKTNPLLSRLIWPANAAVPVEAIRKDIDDFVSHKKGPNDWYYLGRGVDIAANLFQENLETQTPQVVSKTRWRITVLFLLVQLIPFGLIGYAAYEDLKTTT